MPGVSPAHHAPLSTFDLVHTAAPLPQAEYDREGITWAHIPWRDNSPTLELIEGRPAGTPGILVALDDARYAGRS